MEDKNNLEENLQKDDVKPEENPVEKSNNNDLMNEDPNTELEKISEEDITENNDGIRISNDAVSTYAGIAVSEVKGVYGKGGTFSGLTEALSGKKNISKGIKVDVDDKTVKIDVNIVVVYGARIPDVAFEIQSRVKKTVENMTGLKVSEVNVNVLGVHPIDKGEEVTESFDDEM